MGDSTEYSDRGLTASRIRPLNGFWRSTWDNLTFLQCKSDEACLGYPAVPEFEDGCNRALGYSGILCQMCDNHFVSRGNGDCVPCNTVSTIYVIAGIIVFAALSVYFIRSTLAN